MSASDNLARLQRLGTGVITTEAAASVLALSTGAAHKALTRLAQSGLVRKIRHGSWSLASGVLIQFSLAEVLSDPYPAYISLQSAMHAHGMTEQIPSVIYVVTLGRTRRIETVDATFSMHHFIPELFGGFETKNDIRLATPEKALIDLAWLSASKTRRFANVPELTLPHGFRHLAIDHWIKQLPSQRSRSLLKRRYEALLSRT